MDATHTRARLLRQHVRLRELLDATRTLAAQLSCGDGVELRLEARLAELREAFAEHNRDEEAAVASVLRCDDPVNPARLERMLEEHREEHRLMRTFLSSPLEEIVSGLADFVEEIEAHMAAEERTFLSVAVLR